MATSSYSQINTCPGESPDDPFCPPANFKGTNRDYYLLLVERYKSNIEWRQRMVVTARHSCRPFRTTYAAIEVNGPFGREATHFISKLAQSLQTKHGASKSA